MAKIRRAERDKYGEPKKQFQFMLTETASGQLDKVADDLNISRSEIFERIIRKGITRDLVVG
jgi:Ribbon-helix-helix protein, copG family